MNAIRMLTYAMVLVLAGCGGKQTTEEPEPRLPEPKAEATPEAERVAPQQPVVDIPAQPQPEPASVLAVASLPNPVDTLDALERVANSMGRQVAVTEASVLIGELAQQFLGARINGLDYRRPIYVLMVDPALAEVPFVLVGTVASRPALLQSITGTPLETAMHRGSVAIGVRPALEAAAPHALSTLVTAAPPTEAMLSIRLTRLEAALGPQLEEQMDQLEALFQQIEAQAEAQATTVAETEAARNDHRSMRQVLSLARAVLRQGQELRLTLQPTGAPTLELLLQAEPNTNMQQIFAAIEKSDLSLVRLHGDADILFGGRFDPAALPEEVRRELSGRLWLGGTQSYAAMKPLYEQWYGLAEGEIAIAVGGTEQAPPWMVVRQKLEQPAQALPLIRTMGAQGFGTPPELEVDYKREAFRHRGVVVDRVLLTATPTMPAEARRSFEAQYGSGGLTAFVTVVDDQMVSTAGKDARQRITTIIDQVKDEVTPALPDPTAAALARSRQRQETFVLLLDAQRVLGPTAPDGRVGLGVAFTDDAMSARITLPTAPARVSRIR